MKYIYIHTNAFVEQDWKLDKRFNIGKTFDDYLNGQFVLLNDQQVAFRNSHPDASFREVWNMKLDPAPKPIVPDYEEWRKQKVEQINADTDQRILSGYTWLDGNGISHLVWLSSENQFNYKALYDLAVQTDGANLPVKIKLGTDESVEYHTFYEIDELQDFYTGCVQWVNDCLNVGWDIKDTETTYEKYKEEYPN